MEPASGHGLLALPGMGLAWGARRGRQGQSNPSSQASSPS